MEGYGWVEVVWRREEGAGQKPAGASRAPDRETEERERSVPRRAQQCSAREYSRGNGKSPGLPNPPVPSVCPGGGRPSAALRRGPARTAGGTLTPARAASTAHPGSGGQPPASAWVLVSSLSGGGGRSLVMGGAQSAASSLFLRPRPRGGAGYIKAAAAPSARLAEPVSQLRVVS